jgi:hypothetical protein
VDERRIDICLKKRQSARTDNTRKQAADMRSALKDFVKKRVLRYRNAGTTLSTGHRPA